MASVASTTSGMPASCATAASAGEIRDVAGRIADRPRRTAASCSAYRSGECDGRVAATKLVSTPNRRSCTSSWVMVPPYRPAAGDDVVSGPGEAREREELRRLPAGGRHCADPAVEAGEPLLERSDRRVTDAAVDVSVLLQREQVGRIRRVLEDETRALVDRHRPGACHRIGRAPACSARVRNPQLRSTVAPPTTARSAVRVDPRAVPVDSRMSID